MQGKSEYNLELSEHWFSSESGQKTVDLLPYKTISPNSIFYDSNTQQHPLPQEAEFEQKLWWAVYNQRRCQVLDCFTTTEEHQKFYITDRDEGVFILEFSGNLVLETIRVGPASQLVTPSLVLKAITFEEAVKECHKVKLELCSVDAERRQNLFLWCYLPEEASKSLNELQFSGWESPDGELVELFVTYPLNQFQSKVARVEVL